VLSAIHYLHDHFVCHRDLKPNNILCSDDFSLVKITDFNVSKFSDQYKEFGNLENAGKIEMWTYTGTVGFSAPEIFSGGIYK
jgi:calcium/calmodulin-dependent protein kinase I